MYIYIMYTRKHKAASRWPGCCGTETTGAGPSRRPALVREF